MENHVSDEPGSDREEEEEEEEEDEVDEEEREGGGGGGRGRKTCTRREHRPLSGCASMITSTTTENGHRHQEEGRRCSSVKQSQSNFAVNDPNNSANKNSSKNSTSSKQRGMPNSASLANISSNDPANQRTSSNVACSIPTSKSDAMLNGCMALDELPNMLVYRKMEDIVKKMQDEKSGVPVKTVKSFMAKIPSVFTGTELVPWMMKYQDIEDTNEALHLAHLMAAHGYFFPIDDHVLTVKCDNTFYRFQTPYYWPSNHWEPENIDYAVYLCKRTMQNKTRLELVDYEAENLARLQKMFSRKWEFIFMQAEAQAKVDKKRDKLERKVLDSQERAFWDVHRPVPGCVNTTEVDIKKACRMNKPLITTKTSYQVPGGRISPSVSVADLPVSVEDVKDEVVKLRKSVDRRRWKVSKVADAMCNHFEQYQDFDPFMTSPEPSNPWISESTEFWEAEKTMKDIPQRRVKRWGFSIHELLKDPAGKDQLAKFLDKEFSQENLRFWLACEELKTVSSKDVCEKVHEIYNEFLGPQAHYPINVDARVAEITTRKVQNQLTDRHTFDEAQEHIFNLMKNDSYTRYLRSDMYREFLNGSKKKSKIGRLSLVR